MRRMKKRVTLSLEEATAVYLERKAGERTGGNVSAFVEKLAREAALQESVTSHAAWYAAHPGVLDDAEAERLAARDAGRDAA